MKRNHKVKVLIVLILLSAVSSIVVLSINNATAKLVSLGYDQAHAKSLVNVSNMFDVATKQQEKLTTLIKARTEDSEKLGIESNDIDKLGLSQTKLYSDYQKIDNLCTETESNLKDKLKSLEIVAKEANIDYKYKTEDIYNRYTYLNKLVTSNQNALIKKYTKSLTDLGFSTAQINKLKSSDKTKTLKNLKKTISAEKARIKKLDGFQSETLKEQAMRMFKLTNQYRASLGLKAYTYNYSMQSCVFKEAAAYASNKNPHNWLCSAAANENAGLSSETSDYVQVAMDFFISDPPHEAVLSGNYKSVAIAIVNKDGMNYMIMDVFN
ncbi:CAP domain-containing protein [Mycoplasma sp. P36-A1]|uniref:CAP domain-containing protein n=1 Tax=Mycoplasma sp. P36-A1 TaxID=3252900 RepID=UPI003C2E06CA